MASLILDILQSCYVVLVSLGQLATMTANSVLASSELVFNFPPVFSSVLTRFEFTTLDVILTPFANLMRSLGFGSLPLFFGIILTIGACFFVIFIIRTIVGIFGG